VRFHTLFIYQKEPYINPLILEFKIWESQVRTEIDEETITRLGKLKIKIPPKILNDSRRKPVRPPSKPGRPKKVTPDQLTLT